MSEIKEVIVEVAKVFLKKYSLGQTGEAPMIEILVPSVMVRSLAFSQWHPHQLGSGCAEQQTSLFFRKLQIRFRP